MSKLCLKGNIIFCDSKGNLFCHENSYLIADGNNILGVFKEVPGEYEGINIENYGDCIIMPGLIDMHTHAPQYTNAGRGLDLQLLEWLKTYTFPEESKYIDNNYALLAYTRFVRDLLKSATTRAVVFATVHKNATYTLMELMDNAGLCAYVGKVNMDRNCTGELCEQTEKSLCDTEEWIKTSKKRYKNVAPIITPRFVPTCSKELLHGLGELAKKYNLKVQSHLSENKSEIAWVHELEPDLKTYTDVYNKYGLLFGSSVMAHCIHLSEYERELMKENKTFIAHCPNSNMNILSGIAPVCELLSCGLNVTLGTDISGGFSLSMFRAMSDAIQASKIRSYYEGGDFLSVPQVFYMATVAGGKYFGKVGSFEAGYELDCLVIDDSNLGETNGYTLPERLERTIYLADDRNIKAKFVAGKKII